MENERILLRPVNKTDAESIFSYRSLPEVAKYQYWEPFTKEQALNFVTRHGDADPNKKDDWVALAIINKKNNELIGDCALKISANTTEIGCNIAPGYQHRGFAKETLELLFEFCFKNADTDEIYGITDSENTTSVKLMKSLNMYKIPDFEEKTICKGVLCTEHKYVIRKPDWDSKSDSQGNYK